MKAIVTPCLVVAAMFMAGVLPASSATYKLPISMSTDIIMRIFVDEGEVHRIERKDGISWFEVTMPEGRCSDNVRIVFGGFPKLEVAYDVCSEEGFGLDVEYRR